MRVLLWHVHGSWTTALVQGRHEYLFPVTPDRGPDGRGRAATYHWPSAAREVPYDRLRDLEVDVVLLQRPHELQLVEDWLGRRPGRDLPAIYVEHNTPKGDVPWTRHPLADRDEVPIVHVTYFNAVFWDNGRAPVVVVEHGIVDPGERYTGELPRVAVAVNEPLRRGRVTGTDLLPAFATVAPLDIYGIAASGVRAGGLPGNRVMVYDDPPQAVMHAQLARRRVYLHPMRWTSLGLSLIEAMQLGMPVVALGCTEAFEAVPPEAGVVSTSVERLTTAVREFLADPDAARLAGKAGREAALERYGLDRFLADWDRLLREVRR